MKKKGKVAIAMMLMVAMVASMAFVSAVVSSEDTPEDAQNSAYRDIDIAYPDIDIVYLDIDIAYRADSNVTSEEGTGGEGARADYNVDGGWLKIDEGAGNICTGNAQGAQLLGVPAGGASCKITVDYSYTDMSDIIGGYAIFRLTAPDSGVDEDRIADRWGFDDSCTGELSRTFIIYPNNRYVFTIYCERDDDSFTDSASIFT